MRRQKRQQAQKSDMLEQVSKRLPEYRDYLTQLVAEEQAKTTEDHRREKVNFAAQLLIHSRSVRELRPALHPFMNATASIGDHMPDDALVQITLTAQEIRTLRAAVHQCDDNTARANAVDEVLKASVPSA